MNCRVGLVFHGFPSGCELPRFVVRPKKDPRLEFVAKELAPDEACRDLAASLPNRRYPEQPPDNLVVTVVF